MRKRYIFFFFTALFLYASGTGQTQLRSLLGNGSELLTSWTEKNHTLQAMYKKGEELLSTLQSQYETLKKNEEKGECSNDQIEEIRGVLEQEKESLRVIKEKAKTEGTNLLKMTKDKAILETNSKTEKQRLDGLITTKNVLVKEVETERGRLDELKAFKAGLHETENKKIEGLINSNKSLANIIAEKQSDLVQINKNTLLAQAAHAKTQDEVQRAQNDFHAMSMAHKEMQNKVEIAQQEVLATESLLKDKKRRLFLDEMRHHKVTVDDQHCYEPHQPKFEEIKQLMYRPPEFEEIEHPEVKVERQLRPAPASAFINPALYNRYEPYPTTIRLNPGRKMDIVGFEDGVAGPPMPARTGHTMKTKFKEFDESFHPY